MQIWKNDTDERIKKIGGVKGGIFVKMWLRFLKMSDFFTYLQKFRTSAWEITSLTEHSTFEVMPLGNGITMTILCIIDS